MRVMSLLGQSMGLLIARTHQEDQLIFLDYLGHQRDFLGLHFSFLLQFVVK